MILALDLQPQKLYSAVHELIRMVFPEYEIRMGVVAKADGVDYFALLRICGAGKFCCRDKHGWANHRGPQGI